MMTKYERTVQKDGISGGIVFYSKTNPYTKDTSIKTLIISWENSTTIQPDSVDREIIRALGETDSYYQQVLIEPALIAIMYQFKARGISTEEHERKLLPITSVLSRSFYKVNYISF